MTDKFSNLTPELANEVSRILAAAKTTKVDYIGRDLAYEKRFDMVVAPQHEMPVESHLAPRWGASASGNIEAQQEAPDLNEADGALGQTPSVGSGDAAIEIRDDFIQPDTLPQLAGGILDSATARWMEVPSASKFDAGLEGEHGGHTIEAQVQHLAEEKTDVNAGPEVKPVAQPVGQQPGDAAPPTAPANPLPEPGIDPEPEPINFGPTNLQITPVLQVGAYGQATIQWTDQPITIDGLADNAWGSAATFYLNSGQKLTKDNLPSASDFSGSFKVLWDDANFYLRAEIIDDIIQTSDGFLFNNDNLQIYFDIANDDAAEYGADDFQYGFQFGSNAFAMGHYSADGTAGVLSASSLIPGGYTIELSIPWATLGVTPWSGMTFGFSVDADDEDGGSDADNLGWDNTNSKLWTDQSLFNQATLSDAPLELRVDETADAGRVVAQLSASDANGDTLTYRVIGSGGDKFEVVGTELRVRAGATLNADVSATEAVTIEVSDGKGGILVETVSIAVNATSTAPTDIDLIPVAPQTIELVNTTLAADQEAPKIALLADGGYVIVWTSRHQDGDGRGVFGQRFDAGGNKIGSEFQVNQHTAGDQQDPVVEGLPNGGFIVAYETRAGSSGPEGTSGDGVIARVYDADGTPGTEFVVNQHTSGNQRNPDIAVQENGSYAVVYDSSGVDGSNQAVVMQLFNADHTPNGARIQVNQITTNAQEEPEILLLADGNYLVTWETRSGEEGTTRGVFARIIEPDGTPAGNEFRVNTYTADDQRRPEMALLENGGFVVVWDSNGQDGHDEGVFGQIYDASANPIGGEFQVNTGEFKKQGVPSVTGLKDGGFIVVYESRAADNNFATGILAQRFDADGTMVGDEITLSNNAYQGWEYTPDIVLLPDGSLLVTWAGQNTGDGTGRNIVTTRILPEVYENAVPGTVVGTLQATDNDAGDVMTYELLDDAGGLFVLDGTQIRLAPSQTLDYETAASHDVQVRATDKWGNSLIETIRIDVGDVNEAPTSLDFTNTAGAPDSYSEAVLALAPVSYFRLGEASGTNAADETGTATAIYKNGVLHGADGPFLNVSTTAADLDGSNDYISIAPNTGHQLAEGSISFWINSDALSGSKGLFALASQDGWSMDLAVYSQGLVGLFISDPNHIIEYSIHSAQNTFVANEWQQITIAWDDGGIELFRNDVSLGSVNFPHGFSNPITNIVFGGNLWGYAEGEWGAPWDRFNGKIAEIAIFDSRLDADAVADLHATAMNAVDIGSVDEDASAGTVVGTVTAEDPDSGESLTYSLIDDAGGRFAIGADSGEITVAAGANLDHEAIASHEIIVRVTDGGGLNYDKTVTINIGDVNEAPTGIVLSSNSFGGGAAPGATIATLSAIDPDSGDTHTYSLEVPSNTIHDLLANDPSTPLTIDWSGTSSSNIELTAMGQMTGDDSIIYHVFRIRNETAFDEALSLNAYNQSWEVDFTSPAGSETYILSPYGGTAHRLFDEFDSQIHVRSPSTSAFSGSTLIQDETFPLELVGDEIRVKADATLDYDTVTTYDFNVTATDSGGLTHSKDVTVDFGTDGGDTLTGNAAGGILYGFAGNDTILGGDGDDWISGGLGDDAITGGLGNDTMYGDEGSDLFMYSIGDGSDFIDGGEGSSWLDVIQVSGVTSGLDANGLGSDWTVQIEQGSIISSDANSITLSQDADGAIIFNDGSLITFENIERVEWA